MVGYAFRTDAIKFQGSHGVPSRTFASLVVGNTIDVMYDPGRPSLSEPRVSLLDDRFDTIVSTVFLGLVGAAGVLGVRSDERKRGRSPDRSERRSPA